MEMVHREDTAKKGEARKDPISPSEWVYIFLDFPPYGF